MPGKMVWRCSWYICAMASGESPMASPLATIAPVELPAYRSKLFIRPGLPAASSASSAPLSQRQVTRPRMPPPSSERIRFAFMAWSLLDFAAAAAPTLSIPLHERDAEADVGGAVVVVDHALAVAVENLQVAAEAVEQRERPVELHRAMRLAAAAQRMAQHQRELLAVGQHPHEGGVAAAHVVGDVGIVVVVAVGHPDPRPQVQRPALAVQADVEDHPVPAARERIGAAVGLVVDADRRQPPLPAEHAVAGAEGEHHFRLVVGLAERPRLFAVVD